VESVSDNIVGNEWITPDGGCVNFYPHGLLVKDADPDNVAQLTECYHSYHTRVKLTDEDLELAVLNRIGSLLQQGELIHSSMLSFRPYYNI